MHTPSLIKINWCLLQLSSRNENMGMSLAYNCQNLPISNPKPHLHNIDAHTKFGKNPLLFAQVIIRKWNTDGWTTDGRTYETDVCLFVLRFYGPVNPMGSCRARSVYLTTRLLGRLSPLSGSPVLCTFFRQKLTTALLESAEGREWP